MVGAGIFSAPRFTENKMCGRSNTEDPLERLKHLAEIFHSKADKSVALRKFSAKLRRFKKTPACKYAAHVAAWFAFAPPEYIPGTVEIELLHGFLLEVGGGQMPTRLGQVLPCAQKALECIGPGHLAFELAREKLQRRLQRFQCCRKGMPAHDQSGATRQIRTASKEAVGYSDRQDAQGCGAIVISDVPSSQCTAAVAVSSERKQSPHIELACQATSPSISGSKRLFKKMNEWTNMRVDDKLTFLQQLKRARKAATNNSQSATADAVYALAAALSAPRKSILSSGSPEDPFDGPIGPDVESSVELTANLQHRVRSLLLQLLHDWKDNGFDGALIGSILHHIQSQISTFEAKATVPK